MSNKIRDMIWRNAFLDLDQEGDPIEKNRKIKSDTSILISNNNRRTWLNQDVRTKRSAGIKKAKQESGITLTDAQRLEIYNLSFQPNRNTNLYAELSEKYNISIDYVNHICSNSIRIVTDQQHKINLSNWEKQFGFFGHWRLHSPGKNLLKYYDKHYEKNMIPPSVIFHIRYKMSHCSPKEIRDYLLPWTNNRYFKNNKGGIENGRYINYRKKMYPWLINEDGQFYDIESMDRFHQFVKQFYGNNLTRSYAHQILNGSRIKEDGPMTAWMFEKIK